MGALTISSFKYGMDRRRPRSVSAPGTLWSGRNVVISRGGDVEAAKKFVAKYHLPGDATHGATAVRGQLYVFGSGPRANDMPAGVEYQRLQSPFGDTMSEVLDVRAIDGKLYVIARYAAGHIHHFYDGTRVEDWDTIADADSSFTTLANYMAEITSGDPEVTAVAAGETITFTARRPGYAFYVLAAANNAESGVDDQTLTVETVQPDVPEITGVAATATLTVTGGSFAPGVNRVSSVLAGNTELLSAPIDWTLSHSATAAAVAASITDGMAVHGYRAVSNGAAVVVTAPPGSAPNGVLLDVSVLGGVVASSGTFSGGVDYRAPAAQVMRVTFGGTYEPGDQYILNLNGRAYYATGRASATGISLLVTKKRIWSPANSLWRYCALNDPSDWTTTGLGHESTGAGFINVSSDSEGSERLVGGAVYGTQALVFNRRNIWIYNLSTDQQEFAFAQVLENTGALAARGVVGYGNLDVYYPDISGIRSARARDLLTEAYADDAGAPIDTFFAEHLAGTPDAQLRRAVAAIEPRDRRMFMSVGTRVFVLSYFPKSSIQAWTYIDPGFQITDFARIGAQLYARAGDTIYLYGGDNNDQYFGIDECVVELPFASANPPRKVNFIGFDMACTGVWKVEILPDPNNEAASQLIGTLTGVTYVGPDIGAGGRSTHVAAKLTKKSAGPAVVSHITLYHNGKEPDA